MGVNQGSCLLCYLNVIYNFELDMSMWVWPLYFVLGWFLGVNSIYPGFGLYSMCLCAFYYCHVNVVKACISIHVEYISLGSHCLKVYVSILPHYTIHPLHTDILITYICVCTPCHRSRLEGSRLLRFTLRNISIAYSISRMLCQQQVSRTGTSNNIPHILWNVITCPYFW